MNIMLRNVYSIWNMRTQKWISVICCLMMMVGLLFSRVVLSVSVIAFVINSFHPLMIKKYWWQVVQNGFVLLCVFLFLAYFFAGIGLGNTGLWLKEMMLKLPLLIFPFAFFSSPIAEKKYVSVLIAGILGILFSGVLYSFLFTNYNWDSNIVGVHLAVPLGGDYLRFSLVLLFGVVLSLFVLFERNERLNTFKRWCLILWVGAVSIYLHLLAAKSGILFLYIIYAVFLVSKLYRYNKKLVPIGLSVLLLVGGIGLFKVPQVRAQLKEMVYEVGAWNKDEKADMDTRQRSYIGRMISYVIAIDIIKEKPLRGVGTGNLGVEMKSRYDDFYPYVLQRDRLIPHNQFLSTMVTIGIPFSVLLLLLSIYPLFYRGKYQLYYILNFILLFGFMLFEAILEIQYGIFLFLFMNMFWIKLLRDETKQVLVFKWPKLIILTNKGLSKQLSNSGLYNFTYHNNKKLD